MESKIANEIAWMRYQQEAMRQQFVLNNRPNHYYDFLQNIVGAQGATPAPPKPKPRCRLPECGKERTSSLGYCPDHYSNLRSWGV